MTRHLKLFCLTAALMLLTLPAAAQVPQTDLNLPQLDLNLFGLQITELNHSGGARNFTKTVKWSVSGPIVGTILELHKFRVGLTVHAAGGATLTLPEQTVGASARQATFSAFVPESISDSALKSLTFTAKVTAECLFRPVGTRTATNTFTLSQANNFTALFAGPAPRDGVQVTEVKRLPDASCFGDNECFDVKWTAAAPGNEFTRFEVSGNFQYAFSGSGQNATRIASAPPTNGTTNQVRLTASPGVKGSGTLTITAAITLKGTFISQRAQLVAKTAERTF